MRILVGVIEKKNYYKFSFLILLDYSIAVFFIVFIHVAFFLFSQLAT